MVTVGDKGIVMNSFGDKVFIPLGNVAVGDTVTVYNLVDNTRIAVPQLTLSIGDIVFSTPSFDFAGFDWNLDFGINLIPLDLSFAAIATMTWTSSEFRTGSTHWFGGGEVYPAGEYTVYFQGWWTAWSSPSGWSYDCSEGHVYYPLWCRGIWLVRNYGGEDIEYPVSDYVTETHPEERDSWGYLRFVLDSPGKIGFRVLDSPYSDNSGEAQFNLFDRYF